MTTVFFPGKFQPPHIGHARTIAKLLNKYDKVIVGVTEGPPRVMDREEVIRQFKEIFQIVPMWRIKFHSIDGVLTDYKKLDGIPEFDILITGNDEVVKWAIDLGICVKKVSRSNGIGCSGTSLRRIALNQNKEMKEWAEKVAKRSKKII